MRSDFLRPDILRFEYYRYFKSFNEFDDGTLPNALPLRSTLSKTDSMSMPSKPGKRVPLGHWTISFETKTDHVLACIEIKFRTNKNTIIFAKSSMVFSMTLRDFAKLCAISFSAQRNFLYSKCLILDPIDGPLSFSSICQLCLKCTK